MKLTNKQVRFLKGKAHHLSPTVSVGAKGLSDSVIKELDQALAHHELIKVKLPAVERADRQQLAQSMEDRCQAVTVNVIGRIAILYRAAAEPRLTLPA